MRSASRIRLVLSALLAMALCSCSTPQRLAAVPEELTASADTGLGPIRYQVLRDTEPMAADAMRALDREKATLAAQGQTGALPPAAYLAISGGGDDGAFGAGLLKGWTEAGTRPVFKVVTGISTGALTAPFAFLGPDYDHILEEVYTTKSPKDVLKRRGLLGGLFGESAADSAPLFHMIEHYVDRPLLDKIAAEYAKGRLLLVGTADLDSLEPVIWNMTAIAADRDPRALNLFRRVLLASASIPGVFPPVMIDVTVNGQQHQEMHVDGGTISQVFFYPPSLTASLQGGLVQRQRTLYIIRNARLDPDWTQVQRRTLPIAVRAISSLTQSQGVGDLYRIYATTQRDGIGFNLAYIPSSFNHVHAENFDTAYMKDLFDTGHRLGAAGYNWQKTPPGMMGPAR
jgi:predicted acylesterase/phospholipase RssA